MQPEAERIRESGAPFQRSSPRPQVWASCMEWAPCGLLPGRHANMRASEEDFSASHTPPQGNRPSDPRKDRPYAVPGLDFENRRSTWVCSEQLSRSVHEKNRNPAEPQQRGLLAELFCYSLHFRETSLLAEHSKCSTTACSLHQVSCPSQLAGSRHSPHEKFEIAPFFREIIKALELLGELFANLEAGKPIASNKCLVIALLEVHISTSRI